MVTRFSPLRDFTLLTEEFENKVLNFSCGILLFIAF